MEMATINPVFVAVAPGFQAKQLSLWYFQEIGQGIAACLLYKPKDLREDVPALKPLLSVAFRDQRFF